MRRVFDLKMPKLDVKQKLILILLNIVGFAMLLFTAGDMLLGWHWSLWLVSIAIVLVALWLMVQGGWKAITKFGSSAKHPEGILHVVSFAVGLVLLFIGIASFPPIGMLLNMQNYSVMVDIFYILAAILSILEMFF